MYEWQYRFFRTGHLTASLKAKVEMRLCSRVKFPSIHNAEHGTEHYRGVQNTLFLSLPEWISTQIFHCSRCKISFWVSCSHSPLPAAMSTKNSVQVEQEGIEPWSLNPVHLGIWNPPEWWATLQSTEVSQLPNLDDTKNYQTAQRLKELGINVMSWLSMIWFLQTATWTSLKSPGETRTFRCGKAYIRWCQGPTFL